MTYNLKKNDDILLFFAILITLCLASPVLKASIVSSSIIVCSIFWIWRMWHIRTICILSFNIFPSFTPTKISQPSLKSSPSIISIGSMLLIIRKFDFDVNSNEERKKTAISNNVMLRKLFIIKIF